MINSESSELKQIVRGNIPPNAYFSGEEHVQMLSLSSPYNKSDAYATTSSPVPSCSVGASIDCASKTSQKYDSITKTLEYFIPKHFHFKTMTQSPRFHAKIAELQAQL